MDFFGEADEPDQRRETLPDGKFHVQGPFSGPDRIRTLESNGVRIHIRVRPCQGEGVYVNVTDVDSIAAKWKPKKQLTKPRKRG